MRNGGLRGRSWLWGPTLLLPAEERTGPTGKTEEEREPWTPRAGVGERPVAESCKAESPPFSWGSFSDTDGSGGRRRGEECQSLKKSKVEEAGQKQSGRGKLSAPEVRRSSFVRV